MRLVHPIIMEYTGELHISNQGVTTTLSVNINKFMKFLETENMMGIHINIVTNDAPIFKLFHNWIANISSSILSSYVPSGGLDIL